MGQVRAFVNWQATILHAECWLQRTLKAGRDLSGYDIAVGTPFEGGLFKMKLVLGSDFPNAPPKGMPQQLPAHPSAACSSLPALLSAAECEGSLCNNMEPKLLSTTYSQAWE